MSNPIPNALALSTINDGDQAQGAPLRNNYSAIQAAVNLIRACLAGGVAGQFLQAADATDVQWATGTLFSAIYRKTTSKQVVNTTTETDLLNGEITVAANALGTNKLLRLTAFGDAKQNSGVAQNGPQFKVKLGATTFFDTGQIMTGAQWLNSASRWGWKIVVEIMNTGAANAQQCTIHVVFGGAISSGGSGSSFSTGEGVNGQFANIAEAVGAVNIAADTTLAQALALTVINPAANAALDVTLKGALVEII